MEKLNNRVNWVLCDFLYIGDIPIMFLVLFSSLYNRVNWVFFYLSHIYDKQDYFSIYIYEYCNLALLTQLFCKEA
jgi:hypothetical protein